MTHTAYVQMEHGGSKVAVTKVRTAGLCCVLGIVGRARHLVLDGGAGVLQGVLDVTLTISSNAHGQHLGSIILLNPVPTRAERLLQAKLHRTRAPQTMSQLWLQDST